MKTLSDHETVPAYCGSCQLSQAAEFNQLFDLIATVNRLMSQGNQLSAMLESCMAAIAQALDAASARIWLFDPKMGLLELQAIVGQHALTSNFPIRIPLGVSLMGIVAQNREPYLNNDAAHDLCLGNKDWLLQEQIAAFAGYPLVVEDQLIGVIALFTRCQLNPIVQTVLEAVTHSLAIAIDRIWARDALISRREVVLYRLASQIRNSLDLDRILEAAVNEIRGLLNIDCCGYLWCWPDPDHPSLALTHESRIPGLASFLSDLPTPLEQAMADWVTHLELMRFANIHEATQLDQEVVLLLDQVNIQSLLLLPLETHSGQLGALVCVQNSPRVWHDDEVELLQAVTDQLASAIDQAELYSQSRATALAAQTQAQQLSQTLQQLKQTQAQLVQHEKMSSLGKTVAGVAHEINNPVNFIHGNLTYTCNYLQDLMELLTLYQQHYPNPVAVIQEKAEEIDIDFIAEDLPKVLSSMQMGTDRIRQIVLSLRNFSRLDEADVKAVNLHEGLDSTLLILQNKLKASHDKPEIQVIKEYGNLPLVQCLAGQMNQVFMNILSNAIDALEATGTDAPTIWIRTEVVDQLIVVRIQDNGPGMPEAVRAKLFDPFFTTKEVGKGTGLGLSISYQVVVEKHQGKLTCVSEPGAGAEFLIQIPIEYQGSERSSLPQS